MRPEIHTQEKVTGEQEEEESSGDLPYALGITATLVRDKSFPLSEI